MSYFSRNEGNQGTGYFCPMVPGMKEFSGDKKGGLGKLVFQRWRKEKYYFGSWGFCIYPRRRFLGNLIYGVATGCTSCLDLIQGKFLDGEKKCFFLVEWSWKGWVQRTAFLTAFHFWFDPLCMLNFHVEEDGWLCVHGTKNREKERLQCVSFLST